MVLYEQPFQMNAVLFRYGLMPIQFTVYSYLKFCCGNRNACMVNIRTMAPFLFLSALCPGQAALLLH